VAIEFYKRFGFEIVETKKYYYKRIEPADAHVLQKTLKRSLAAGTNTLITNCNNVVTSTASSSLSTTTTAVTSTISTPIINHNQISQQLQNGNVDKIQQNSTSNYGKLKV